MGLFTGIGDFFRGAFGEDDEEKRRRKERERQAAQARATQNKPQQTTIWKQPKQQPQKNINDLFGKIEQDKKAPQPNKQPEQKPQSLAPRPSLNSPGLVNLNDTEYKAFTVEKKDRKWLDDKLNIKVDKTYRTNKDKFVADFDKLKPELRQAYFNTVKEQAKKGDQAAASAYKALVETNRIPRESRLQDAADIASLPGRNILRVATGIPQGYSGLYDLLSPADLVRGASLTYDKLTPGKGANRLSQNETLKRTSEGTSRVSKVLDKIAKVQDSTAKDAGIETAYKLGNVPVEVASYFIPATIASKVSSNFPKGAKLTDDVIEQVAKFTDNAGEAGKIRKFLADRMRRGWSLDEAIEESLISSRYIGQNASKGNDTSPTSVLTDALTGIGGGLLFPGRSVKRVLDNEPEEVAGSAIAGTANIIEEAVSNKAAIDLEKSITEFTEQELKELASDTDVPAFERQKYKEELDRRTNFQAPANNPAKAAYDAQQSAKRGEGNLFNDMQNRDLNPGDETDIPAYLRKDPDADIADAQRQIDEIDGQLSKTPEQTIEEYKFRQKQKLAEDIRANPSKKDQIIQLYNQRIANADGLKNLDEFRGQLELRKQELQQVIDNANLIKKSTDETITAQGKKVDEAVQAQQTTNAEVKAAQAESVNPNPEVVEPSPAAADPEMSANDGYRETTEEVVFPESAENSARDGLNIVQKVSGDRIWREKIGRPIENLINSAIAKAQRSNFAPVRGVGRFFTGVNTEFGVDPALQAARMQLRGGSEYGKLLRERIADLSKNMTKEQTDRIWANLDPEQAARLDIKGGTMSPQELALHDKLKTLIDNTTAENLRRGLITPEAAQDGYIKRAYSVYDGNTEGLSQFEQGFRQELLGQYKGRKQVSDEMVETAITDPTYLVGKKTAESNAMWAMQDYGNYLSSKNIAVPNKPNAGYTQLPDSPVFGDAAGMWVPRNVAEDFTGFQYNNAMVSAMADVLNVYDRWGVRQAKKQLLTIFNPAVRLGNQVSNRAIFSQLNGVNPIQFNKVFSEVDELMQAGDPLYREAVQQGLTGIDITQADFYAKRIAQSTGDGNLARKAFESIQKSYSNADDKARVAAYVVHRRRGYSAEEAARLVQRGFQDYKSVGFFYDMAAKTPIIGNAFVRFVADSMRIAKNAAVDHPLRTASTLALWSMFTNGMSIISGEGRGDTENGQDVSSSLKGDTIPEKAFSLITGSSKGADQKTREDRFGAPKIPFTNVSMTTQTPWGEINAARFMPWYSLNEISDGAQKYLPISQSPVTIEDGKPQVNGAGFADPLLGQFFQLGFDKDFRNKSIADPDNTGQFRDDLPASEQLNNRLRFLFNNNAPMGREIDSVLSAYNKEITPFIGSEEGKDIYGKVRTPVQAWLRALGIKTETYGDEQIKDQRETEAYFDERDRIEQELKGMSPEAQAAYKRITGYDKLREMVPNEYEPGTDRYKKYPVYDFPEDKWKDYSTHPELYQLMMDKKIKEARDRGQQVQPEFDPRLSEGFRRQLIENKIVAPGDDAELDQRMYASPEWDYYQQLKDVYKGQFGDDEYTDELVKHKTADFPTKPDILKQYSVQYGLYADGKAVKPEWNDQLTAAKEAYNKETFDWTNKERQARGLDAINWDIWNNPTFGFDETPSGAGYGYGGGGGGNPGLPNDPTANRNTLGSLTDYTASVKRLDNLTPQQIANLSQLFGGLKAGSGGGKTKPKLGASSSGM